VEALNQLRPKLSYQLQVPMVSILYQSVNVNINYPKSHTCYKDVIVDLKAYSGTEDKHGVLQVLCA
jgi:hypothetical protein